jgi:uncharacterized protein
MSIELRPLGVGCNLACHYCYQQPVRDAKNVTRAYDLGAMKAALEKEGGPFSLFGGEPLMVAKADLEEIWRWGFERYGVNSVQTNGVLIDDDHVRMFKQYRVHVGISIDGPGELNDIRWMHSLEKTRMATERTSAAIERLCRAGIPPGLIITLHRLNATEDKLPVLAAWLRDLEGLGVSCSRIHLLESESPQIESRYGLTPAENITALLFFARLEEQALTRIRFDMFTDMKRMLLGEDGGDTSCTWRPCDPYTTQAVRGVEGNGQSTNCGRTNKDGIDFRKAEEPGFERVLALYRSPQEFQGCQGCRFFLMCKGQCPGTSVRGDWRNRSAHCEVWKALYTHFDDSLARAGCHPIASNPIRYLLERCIVDGWERGENITMHALLERLRLNMLARAHQIDTLRRESRYA